MAEQKLENGFTPFPNNILEKLIRMHLAPNQWCILLHIIRKTYGFQKKVDYIANFQISEATGLCKAVVSRCLKELSDRRIITRKKKFIGIQEDWTKWRGLTFQPTLDSKLAESSTPKKLAESSTELTESSTKVSSCAVTQKKKETLQKKEKKIHYFFKNILLTPGEYQKLVDEFGAPETRERLERLSLYKESKGKKYASDYATVLAWARRDAKGGGQYGAHRKNSRELRPRDRYTKP